MLGSIQSLVMIWILYCLIASLCFCLLLVLALSFTFAGAKNINQTNYPFKVIDLAYLDSDGEKDMKRLKEKFHLNLTIRQIRYIPKERSGPSATAIKDASQY